MVADRFFFLGLNLTLWASSPRTLRRFLDELHHLPDIARPKTYNEKMFWRRLIDHNPAFIAYCDKLATKEIFAKLSHPVPVFETLWVGDAPEDFPDELRRDDVVAKHSAGCGWHWFFARKGYDRDAFERRFKAWLEAPYGTGNREWAYSAIKPRIFAERVIDPDPRNLLEFKIHLFGGEVFYTVVYVGEKTADARSAIFGPDGERLTVTTSLVERKPWKALPEDFSLPPTYVAALDAAREIARDLDYIRVDFYHHQGRLYGGEITPYPTAGLMTNSCPETMARMATAWDLEKSWFLRARHSGWRSFYQALLRRNLPHTA